MRDSGRPERVFRMLYDIVHETGSRMRIRMNVGKLSRIEEWMLKYIFIRIDGVKRVDVYRATAGCAIAYQGSRDALVRQLDAFQFEEMRKYSRQIEQAANVIKASQIHQVPSFGTQPETLTGNAGMETGFGLVPASEAGTLEQRLIDAFARSAYADECKKKQKTKVVFEALADMVLPQPLQIGYHVIQLLAFS